MFIVENKMEGSKFRIYLIVIFLAIPTSQCLSIEDDQSDKVDATTKDILEGQNLQVDCIGIASKYWTKQGDPSFRENGRRLSQFQVKRSFTGHYDCHDLFNNKVVMTVYVNVQYPGKILQIMTNGDIFHDGDSLNINVTVEGNPKPTTSLTNTRNGSTIFQSNTNGTFNISKQLSCIDTATFTLSCLNQFGNSVRNMNLKVFCPPAQYPYFNRTAITQPRIGTNISLNMESTGYPYPTYTWSFMGLDIDNHTDSNTTSELPIRVNSPSDFGTYTLMMENDIGNSSYEYNVQGFGPPDPVTKFQVVNVASTSALLSWFSGYNYNDSQTFIIMSYNIDTKIYTDFKTFPEEEGKHGMDTVTHELDTLQPNTFYRLYVQAHNSRGSAHRTSNVVSFNTTSSLPDIQKMEKILAQRAKVEGSQTPIHIGYKADESTKDVLEGQNLQVECIGIASKYWTKQGDPSFRENGRRLSQFKVKRNFTGHYECRDLFNNKVVMTVYVNVQYPGKILDMKTNGDTFHDKDVFSINVTVEGNPKPMTSLTNTRNGSDVFQANTNGALYISKQVSCIDTATFTLSCKNQFGHSNTNMSLKVMCPPAQYPYFNRTAITQPRIGTNISLNMENTGYPYPTYTWSFMGLDIDNHTDSNTSSSLQIGVNSPSDFGTYTLIMENDLGNSSYDYTVQALGPPDPVTKLHVVNVASTAALISWFSGYNYNDSQTFIVMMYNNATKTYTDYKTFPEDTGQHGMDNVTHVLDTLQPNTPYRLYVQAHNSRGSADRTSNVITFTTTNQTPDKDQHTGLLPHNDRPDPPPIIKDILEGHNLFVECEHAPLGVWVAWRKDDSSFIRYERTLIISSISRTSTGTYICGDVIDSHRHFMTIYVNVQYPAKIRKVTVSNHTFIENDTLTIHVDVEGNPTPITTLVNDRNKAVISRSDKTGSIAIIHVMECTDMSSYTLSCQNQFENDVVHESFTVFCAPEQDPSFNRSMAEKPRLGSVAALRMESTGYPLPSFTWWFKGKELNNHVDKNMSSELVLHVNTPEDYGTYTIVMSNKAGNNSYDYDVQAFGPPEPTTYLNISHISTNMVELSWLSGFDYDSHQTFNVLMYNNTAKTFTDLKKYEESPDSHGIEVVNQELGNLERNTTYTIEIQAHNEHGDADKVSNIVKFTTEIGTIDITIAILQGYTLLEVCNITVSTNHSVVWKKLDGTFHHQGRQLSIFNITRNYTGIYVCEDVLNNTNSELYHIDVQYPAKILSVTTNNDTFNANETFTMKLNVEGNPAPSTTFVNTQTGHTVFMTNETGYLEFNLTMSCDNMGQYIMTCSNKIYSTSRNELLKVYCAPAPISSFNRTTVIEPRLHDKATLLMENTGYPFPNYTWLFNGTRLKSHTDGNISSRLDLTVLSPNNFGNYTLIMANTIGRSTYVYNVKANGPPDDVSELQIEAIAANNAEISWFAGYDYNDRQNFTVLVYNSSVDIFTAMATYPEATGSHGLDTVKKTLTYLNDNTNYTIKVESRNSRGASTAMSNTVSFTTQSGGIDSRIEIEEGNNLTIVCNVTETGNDSIIWTSPNRKHVHTGRDWTISSISRNFTGKYICEDSKNNSNYEIILLDVLFPPELTDMTINNDTFHANETFTLEFSVDGNPKPHTTLTQDDTMRVLLTEHGNGTFKYSQNMSCSDIGVYQLESTNNLGVVHKMLSLNVYCAPDENPLINRTDTVQPRLGSKTELKMSNYGFPYPSYSWWFNGKQISGSDDRNLSSILTVDVKSPTDFGTYTVEMMNEFGNSSYQYDIQAYGPPDTVTNVAAANVSASSTVVSWYSGFDYDDHQVFVVMVYNETLKTYTEFRTDDEGADKHGLYTVNYLVGNLTAKTTYTFEIQAKNSRGTAAMSAAVTLTTKDSPSNNGSSSPNKAVIGSLSALGALALIIAGAVVYFKCIKRRNYTRTYN